MSKYLSTVLCGEHPELEGLRWRGNRKCVKCDAERSKLRVQERRKDETKRKAEYKKIVDKRREKYANDPLFREKERARARDAARARRAAAKSSLGPPSFASNTREIALGIASVV